MESSHPPTTLSSFSSTATPTPLSSPPRSVAASPPPAPAGVDGRGRREISVTAECQSVRTVTVSSGGSGATPPMIIPMHWACPSSEAEAASTGAIKMRFRRDCGLWTDVRCVIDNQKFESLLRRRTSFFMRRVKGSRVLSFDSGCFLDLASWISRISRSGGDSGKRR